MAAWLLWSVTCQFTVIGCPGVAVVGAVTLVKQQVHGVGGCGQVQAGGVERRR